MSVAWWRSGYVIGLATNRSQVRVPADPLHERPWASFSHTHTHTHIFLCSPRSINWYRPKGGDALWLALAMRRRLSGMSTYWLNGLGKGDEHPAYAPLEYYGIFTFFTILSLHSYTHSFIAPRFALYRDSLVLELEF